MGRSPSPVVRRREEKKDREERRDRPRRHRSRSRSRSRDRRERRRSVERRRSASPTRRRRVSRSPDPNDLPGTSAAPKRSKKRGQDRPTVTQADLEGKSPEEQEMLRVMGFCGFDTTKGKKVEDNDVGDVQVVLKRKYRQYMNRKGGFNRPLDFVA